MLSEVRIDKWLWAVRLFKTRSLASEACKKGRVMINNQLVKSSRILKIGDTVLLKRPPVEYQYKVLNVSEKRMGAKLVSGFLEDLTPDDQLEIIELQKLSYQLNRQRGTGRPTKKERRDIETFTQDDTDI